MCFTKLRVEVEQWEDEGVFLVSRLSVESVPADDVVQEEWDEEDTGVDRIKFRMITTKPSKKPISILIVLSFV